MGERVALIGAGAVGGSIASMVIDAGSEVTLVADRDRAARLRSDGLAVNDHHYAVRVDDAPDAYDLVIVATKATHLNDAMPMIVSAAGSSGLVVSLLNGISSEGAIRRAIGGEPSRVVDAMILGIDAVRAGRRITYRNRGTIHFGLSSEHTAAGAHSLDAVERYFARVGIPARRSDDIRRTLWWKFMINVGINQASAVLRAPYGLFQTSPDARDLMVDAMREVLVLSRAEGVDLRESDIDAWLETLAGLDPDGQTSMVQDILAERATEVDLFAGTVVDLAREHDLDVPVNRALLRIIRALEAGWSS